MDRFNPKVYEDGTVDETPLPFPDQVLGDLVLPSDQWPVYGAWREEDRTMYLRETMGHRAILRHFTKIAVMAKVFDNNSWCELISEYMTPSLEAFVILVYVNNHERWFKECNRMGGEDNWTRR
jgi:hypothetical protein